MRRIILPMMLTLAACASAPSEPKPSVSLACNDLVVVARVKNGNYVPVKSDSDLLGHGNIELTVTIKKILRGSEPRKVVTANIFAHNYVREDTDLWLVLAPKVGDGYEVVLRVMDAVF